MQKAVWLRCFSVEDPQGIFSFVASCHTAFRPKTEPLGIFRQALSRGGLNNPALGVVRPLNWAGSGRLFVVIRAVTRYDFSFMIKALLLILAPAGTWERIARSRRSIPFALFIYLVPTMALSLLIELAGHNYLAPRFAAQGVKVLPHDIALKYAAIEFSAGLLAAILIAPLIKVCSETFHNRTSFTQCFAVVAYALGPFYLFHIFNAIPVLSPWIPFGVGIFFSVSTLYHAIPQVLKPDPPHAFGLFLMSAFVLTMLSLIARIITMLAKADMLHLH